MQRSEYSALDREFSELACGYCGSITYAISSKDTICHFCEAYVNTAEEAIKADETYAKLSVIQKLISSSSFEDALKATDALSSKATDLRVLFGSFAIYAAASDARYYDRDYNRSGFMEENSSNVYASLDLVSKEKESAFKFLRLSAEKQKSSPDRIIEYLRFITNVRLKRRLYAKRSLDLLESSGTVILSLQYARMVYAVEYSSGNPESLLSPMLIRGSPNSYYYLSRSLFRRGKYAEARMILQKLSEKIRMPMAASFSVRVDDFIKKTEM